MEHNHHNHNHNQRTTEDLYSFKNFLPLIIIISIIISCTIIKQLLYGLSLSSFMYDFMGFFFLIFSIFKIINIRGFAQAYRMYDLIAKHSPIYAYIYPFIEFTLGILYLTRYQLFIANVITVLLMTLGSIGVAYELAQKKEIMCACLGAVFKIPMTYVTLIEDIIMGIMAFIMLIQGYY